MSACSRFTIPIPTAAKSNWPSAGTPDTGPARTRTPFIPNSSNSGTWDFGNIDDAGPPIDMGQELWFYYAGRSTLHNQSPNDGAMGLGTLRRDGFVSLDAGSDERKPDYEEPVQLQGKTPCTSIPTTGPAKSVWTSPRRTPPESRRPMNPMIPVSPFLNTNCVPFHRRPRPPRRPVRKMAQAWTTSE